MKNLILPFLCIALLFGCKDKNKAESHPDTHSSIIEFDVTNEANIGSYNVYRNDDVIGQMASHASTRPGHFTLVDEVPITAHPISLKYTIEPLFYDSSSANVDVALRIKIDDNPMCSTPVTNLKLGDVAEVTCSIK